MAMVCDSCHKFKAFGKSCWFFWEGKQTCTQFQREPTDEPHYESVEAPLIAAPHW
jgi:hypothetical protein